MTAYRQVSRPTERPGFGRLQLYQADGAFPESPLAVGEIEVPQPDEILAVAERRQLGCQRQKALAPVGQCASVVMAVIVQPHQLHVGFAGQQSRHLGDARQAATGEDIALDEVDPAQVLGMALIGDSDGLNKQAPTGFEQARQLAKVVRQKGVTHRFDHLDGDQLVEPPLQLAVILQQQGDAIPEPLPPDPLFCVVVLGLGDGGGSHPAAVVASSKDGQPTPAGPDLQQMIVRAELEPLADGTQLGLLPLFQGGLRVGIDGARILHMAVEKTLIKSVAEIVVGGDVGARPGQGIATPPVAHLVEREAEPAQAPLQTVEQSQVAGQQPHQRHRIRAGP